MKRFVIILLVVSICGTTFASPTRDAFRGFYDDLLEWLRLQRLEMEQEALEQMEVGSAALEPQDSVVGHTDPIGDDVNSYVISVSDDIIITVDYIPGGQPDNSESSVIANPEPCSIILSSLGLGIAGYLKRRRAI